MNFDLYKSAICHRVKSMGDLEFIAKTLQSDIIDTYFEYKWYPEALYLVAMVDYLSRVHRIPLYTGYEKYRKCKLKQPIYAEGTLWLDMIAGDRSATKKAEEEAIPEFKRFGIMEKDVRDIA